MTRGTFIRLQNNSGLLKRTQQCSLPEHLNLSQLINPKFVSLSRFPTFCPIAHHFSVLSSAKSGRKILRLYLDSRCKRHHQCLINLCSDISFPTVAWSDLSAHLPFRRCLCFLVRFGCSFIYFPKRVVKYII